MGQLDGRVTVVAGASRGAGRGIALALGDAGAKVYVVGRTTRAGPKPADGAPGTIEDTASAVSERGGTGIAVRADLTDPDDVAALFGRIEREEERLDVLANAVWGGGDAYGSADDWIASMGRPFWERSADLWRHMMVAGPYAYYLASAHAARLMAAHGGGLIVSVTDGLVEGASGDEYQGQLMWDVAHRCIDRMMAGMSEECRKHGIAVVTLMPGFMQTERVVRLLTTDALRKQFRFDLSESTEYVGRAVAALAADRNVMRQSGRVHFVADLAEEYGFTDIDGRRVPRFAPFG